MAMHVFLIYCDVGSPWRSSSMLELGIIHQMLEDAHYAVSSHCVAWFTDLKQVIGDSSAGEPSVVVAYVDGFNWPATQALFASLPHETNVTYLAIGPYATLSPDNILRTDPFNGLIAGEPESALFEVISQLAKRQSLSQIRNVWWRNAPGQLVRNPLRPLLDNLDTLPLPNRTLVENDWLHRPEERPLYLRASVGCPYECIFCHVPILKRAYQGKGDFYRTRSAASVAGELLGELRRGAYTNIIFTDDIFPTSKAWLRVFAQHVKGIEIPPWEATVAIDHLDEESLDLMKSAGCGVLHIGIETGNEAFRKRLANRNLGAANLQKICKAATERGMKIVAHVMIDLPLESLALAHDTVALLRDLNIHAIKWTQYYPVEKTPLGEHAKARLANRSQGPGLALRASSMATFSETSSAELQDIIKSLTQLNISKQIAVLPSPPSYALQDLLLLLPQAEISTQDTGEVAVTTYRASSGFCGLIEICPFAKIIFPELSFPPQGVLRFNISMPERTEQYLRAKGGASRLEVGCQRSDGHEIILLDRQLEPREISLSRKWREILIPIPPELSSGRLIFKLSSSVSNPEEVTLWIGEPTIIAESALLKSRETERQAAAVLLAEIEKLKKQVNQLEEELAAARQREEAAREECAKKTKRIGELQMKIIELENQREQLEKEIHQCAQKQSVAKLIRNWLRFGRH